MADTVSVTQAVLLRAFKLVDGIAGEINGVPNEPTDDMADDIAMDLAEAIGVPFDEHWPEAAAAALASTQPAPAFPRDEGHDLLLLRAMLCLSGFSGEGLCVDGFGDPADLYSDIAHSIGMEDADDETLRRHIVIEQQRAALLQGKQP